MARIFLTGDHHFNHANIIKHASRPFASAEEMNAVLVKNWNSRVRPRDTVYFLGDFAMRSSVDIMTHIFGSLHGRKILVAGNHDGKRTKKLPWAEQHVYLEMKLGRRHVIMFHYPLRSWNRRSHGAWHLHGHCHGNANEDLWEKGVADVGVDARGYAPVSWEEIERELEERER